MKRLLIVGGPRHGEARTVTDGTKHLTFATVESVSFDSNFNDAARRPSYETIDYPVVLLHEFPSEFFLLMVAQYDIRESPYDGILQSPTLSKRSALHIAAREIKKEIDVRKQLDRNGGTVSAEMVGEYKHFFGVLADQLELDGDDSVFTLWLRRQLGRDVSKTGSN
jgi:hypothetical protein